MIGSQPNVLHNTLHLRESDTHNQCYLHTEHLVTVTSFVHRTQSPIPPTEMSLGAMCQISVSVIPSPSCFIRLRGSTISGSKLSKSKHFKSQVLEGEIKK